jgi:hypothetical protein
MPNALEIPPRIIVMRRVDYNDARIEKPELFTDPFTRVVPYPSRDVSTVFKNLGPEISASFEALHEHNYESSPGIGD